MKRIQFYLEEDIYKHAINHAKYMGLTIDNMARHALYQYMKKNKKRPDSAFLYPIDKIDEDGV